MKTEWLIKGDKIRLVLSYDKQSETSSGTSGCCVDIATGKLSDGQLYLTKRRMWKTASINWNIGEFDENW